jgi:DHA3 family tetracycline resistance protein-like MFS transporter
MASVGFDRLWVAHFEYNIGFPEDANPLIWLAAIRIGTPLIGLAAIELIRRSIDPTTQSSVVRALIVIYGLQQASLLLFSLAASFAFGVGAFWAVVSMFRAYSPVQVALINRHVDSSVRATVLSISSQVDSIGTIAAGPITAALASLFSIRIALLGSVAVMSLALPLLLRIARLARDPEPERP